MYFYNDGQNEVGPFNEEKLKKLLLGGLIGPKTLLRSEGNREWKSVEEVLSNPRTSDGAASPPVLRPPQNQVRELSDRSPSTTGAPDNHAHELDSVGEANISEETSTAISSADLNDASEATKNVAVLDGWLLYPVTPWRRYAARLLDTSFNGAIGFLLFSIALYSIVPATADEFFQYLGSEFGVFADVVLTGFFASLVGGALIGVTGFTLGKWIFGVKVTRIDRSKPGLLAGIGRDFAVFVKGLGLGIPFVALFTMFLSYRKLVEDGKTNWDSGSYLIWHRPSGAGQYILNVIGLVLIVIVLGSLGALSQV